MQLYGPIVFLMAFLAEVRSIRRITLDDDSQALCKKYKMMCKSDKICAVQHFDWPSNITIPVCIPLSFIPVRNMICQLPAEKGRCHARYTRWYYNTQSQECAHFQFGGCGGNQNNFMSKSECEKTCISTPSIRLYEGGQSELIQPSIITAPVYEPPKVNTHVEALNSVREPIASTNYDRYDVTRRRPSKSRNDEASITRTRRRLDKEREKERKRREKKKEKKRLKKLRREQRKLRCQKRREKGKKCKKNRKGGKKKKSNKKKTTDAITEVEDEKVKDTNEVVKDGSEDVVKETRNIINNEIEAAETEDDDSVDRKRDKKRKKRKLRDKRKNEKDRNRRNLFSRKSRRYSDYTRHSGYHRGYPQYESSLIHTLDLS